LRNCSAPTGTQVPRLAVDRTAVWCACVRLGLPLLRVPARQEADQRRFAYPHRMMMVLADGKHFLVLAASSWHDRGIGIASASKA
jgi:hypothetical protein